jgi:hypothetical protein
VWDQKMCGETSTCLAKDLPIFVSISVQQYKFNTLGGIAHRLLVREEYILGVQSVLYQEILATPQLR